jgi:hypothetical protein
MLLNRAFSSSSTSYVKWNILLSDVISKYHSLVPTGSATNPAFKSLCSFHDDKHPSMIVTDGYVHLHCPPCLFSCHLPSSLLPHRLLSPTPSGFSYRIVPPYHMNSIVPNAYPFFVPTHISSSLIAYESGFAHGVCVAIEACFEYPLRIRWYAIYAMRLRCVMCRHYCASYGLLCALLLSLFCCCERAVRPTVLAPRFAPLLPLICSALVFALR